MAPCWALAALLAIVSCPQPVQAARKIKRMQARGLHRNDGGDASVAGEVQLNDSAVPEDAEARGLHRNDGGSAGLAGELQLNASVVPQGAEASSEATSGSFSSELALEGAQTRMKAQENASALGGSQALAGRLGSQSIVGRVQKGIKALIDEVESFRQPDPRILCSGQISNQSGFLGCTRGCRCNWYERCQPKYLVRDHEGELRGDPLIMDVGVCALDPEFMVFSAGGSFFTFSCIFLLCTSFQKGYEESTRKRGGQDSKRRFSGPTKGKKKKASQQSLQSATSRGSQAQRVQSFRAEAAVALRAEAF